DTPSSTDEIAPSLRRLRKSARRHERAGTGSVRNERRTSRQKRARPPLNMKRNAFLAIAIGGLSAGLIDLAQALVLFGTRVPFGIAAGLIGRQAAHGGGAAVYALGIFLHFFIATSAATVYYVASRWLNFLT